MSNPNLYCRCGGDGIYSVIFINHERKTFFKTIVCCSACNFHAEDFSGKKVHDILASPQETKIYLQGLGYINIDEIKTYSQGSDEARLSA